MAALGCQYAKHSTRVRSPCDRASPIRSPQRIRYSPVNEGGRHPLGASPRATGVNGRPCGKSIGGGLSPSNAVNRQPYPRQRRASLDSVFRSVANDDHGVRSMSSRQTMHIVSPRDSFGRVPGHSPTSQPPARARHTASRSVDVPRNSKASVGDRTLGTASVVPHSRQTQPRARRATMSVTVAAARESSVPPPTEGPLTAKERKFVLAGIVPPHNVIRKGNRVPPILSAPSECTFWRRRIARSLGKVDSAIGERQISEGLKLILAEGVCDGICGLILSVLGRDRDAAALSNCCRQIHTAVVFNLEPLDAELRARKARRHFIAKQLSPLLLTESELPDEKAVLGAAGHFGCDKEPQVLPPQAHCLPPTTLACVNAIAPSDAQKAMEFGRSLLHAVFLASRSS